MLEIKDLRIAFDGMEDTIKGIDLHINRGEIVGIAGPSGSGKSLTVWSVIGLSPEKSRMSGTLIYYNEEGAGQDISMPRQARALAGNAITLVPQNPFTSLNPAFRCGTQVSEVLRKTWQSSAQRKASVLQKFEQLGFEESHRIYDAYPFELSGGQLQRIVIAMATIGDPDLVIADEPTTALDAFTQSEIIAQLASWIRAGNKSMCIVSHDISLLRKYCDRIYVMEKGNITYSGTVVELENWMQERMPKEVVAPGRSGHQQGLCEVSGLYVRYQSRRGSEVSALQDVTFQIHGGEVLGLVGSTGCGKSTIAKVLTGIVHHYRGVISFDGRSLDYLRYPEFRRHVQMIFQDPYSALYPHWTVAAYLREAIRLHRLATKREEDAMILGVLDQVGLPGDFALRYPHQLSGGERQRVQIARAVLLQPKLLICDEITSGLDIPIQNQILQLLQQLRVRHQMAILMISHDLRVIRDIADRVLVMEKGIIVEEGSPELIFATPRHPATVALLNAGM